MKALIYTGPHSLEYRDEIAPVASERDVLVRVEAVGICGSDMHAYHGHDSRRPAPLVLGHEAAGHLVNGPRTGERVTINPLITCGRCRYCQEGRSHLCRSRQIISMPPRPGAFAELVRIPERNLVIIPHNLSTSDAALAEPIAVAWHAVGNGIAALRRPLRECRVLVMGGGAIGLASALVLRHFGARDLHVAEPNPLRRAAVRAAVSVAAFAPSEDGPDQDTVDLVIDAVGAEATRAASSVAVASGGVIVHVGLLPGHTGIDIRKLTLQEVALVGSYCYTHSDFEAVVSALAAGHFGPLDWVEERPLAQGAHAFQDLDAGKVAAAKIILHP